MGVYELDWVCERGLMGGTMAVPKGVGGSLEIAQFSQSDCLSWYEVHPCPSGDSFTLTPSLGSWWVRVGRESRSSLFGF